MKILTFRRLIGLTAIGGVAYVHKQRGGDWTLASLQDTLRYILSSAADKLGPARQTETLDRAASMADPSARSGLSDSARAPGDFGRRKDETGRH